MFRELCSVSTAQRSVSSFPKCMHPNGYCLPLMIFLGGLLQLCLTLMNSVFFVINTSFTESTRFDHWKLFFHQKYYHALDSIQISNMCKSSGMEKNTLTYSLEPSHNESSRCSDLKITL